MSHAQEIPVSPSDESATLQPHPPALVSVGRERGGGGRGREGKRRERREGRGERRRRGKEKGRK